HSIIFFFFQAEDGIRYRTVTGVQTCALPILSGLHPPWHTVDRREQAAHQQINHHHEERNEHRLLLRLHCRGDPEPDRKRDNQVRSEERRVGREWGGGWWGGQ